MLMKKYSFLVTGVTSFIGSNVALYLCNQGHNVMGIARSKDTNSLKNLVDKTNFNLIQADLAKNLKINNDVDVIFHAAAQAPNRGATASDYLMNHVIATQKIIDYALKHKVNKLVFCSTISVFGEVKERIVSENTSIINPPLHGLCKYFGELLLQEKSQELSSLAIRLPGVVGPGAHNIWLAKVLNKALNNEDIHITNPHSPFNNVVWIEDLSKFVESLAEKNWKEYNHITLGSEEPITIQEVANTLVSACRSGSKIIGEEKSSYISFTISIDKAKQMFGYNSRTTKEVINLYSKNY